MTTIKERVIALSRNKKVERILAIGVIILLVVCMFLKFWAKKNVTILGMLLILVLIVYRSLHELSEKKIEFLRKNKLKYIILSNVDIVNVCVTWMIFVPIILITGTFIKGTSSLEILVAILITVLAFILVQKITMGITEYFEKKLSKLEE